MKNAVTLALLVLALGLLSGCIVRGQAGFAMPTADVHVAAVAPPPPTLVATVAAPTVVATVPAPPPPRPAVVATTVAPPTAYVVARAPTVAVGVTAVTVSCDPGAPEVLDGVDNNCNGLIDETYVGTGNLQITLGWSTAADLDLHVVEPDGFEISYVHDRSRSGGWLDRDARGTCENGETGENVFWAGTPPPGSYSVRVHYYSGCTGAGPTPFYLSISYGGQILGAYEYTITEDQTVEVASFGL